MHQSRYPVKQILSHIKTKSEKNLSIISCSVSKGRNHFGDLLSAFNTNLSEWRSVKVTHKIGTWKVVLHRHGVTLKISAAMEKLYQEKAYTMHSLRSSCFSSFDFPSATKCLVDNFTNLFNSFTVTNVIKTSPRKNMYWYEECKYERSWQSELTQAISVGIYSDGLLWWFVNVYCDHLFQFLNLIIFAFLFR